ncbi:MAG: VanZ family protein [Solibacillus sp.]
MKKIIIILVLALCAVILMSNTTYEQQSITPELRYLLKNEPFKVFLSQFELTFWGSVVSVETWGYYKFVELLIRKATHFLGYGLIGVILWIFYRKLQWRFPSLLAIGSIAIIASLDEYRQTFIPDRTGAVEDVVIDICGAITLISIAKLLNYFRKRRA